MPPLKPILHSKSARQADFAAASKKRLKKIEQRRYAWRLNRRLLWISVAVLGLFFAACFISYRHNSNRTADTFHSKAKQAAAEGRYDEQAKWLNRYSMLRPNDIDAIVNTALAANSAADSAEREAQPAAVEKARKYLSHAIGRLGAEHPEKSAELRKLLIHRLLQTGGLWFREAEHQVEELESDQDDPQANKWMALALVGQVQGDFYGDRKPKEDEGYWKRLSSRKPGEVLLRAIDLNPTDAYLLENLVRLFAEHPDQFDQGKGDNQERAELLEQRVEKRLTKIEGNLDSRSHLIRYVFDSSRGRTSEAIKTLTAVSQPARQRLEERAGSVSDNDAEKSSIAASVVLGEGPAEFWDYSLLTEVATRVADKDKELARRYFDLLTKVRSIGVSESTQETVYLLAGWLAYSQGDRAKAIDIWKQGLENVDSNSIGLHGAIARLLVETGGNSDGGSLAGQSTDDSEAEIAVERFRDAIKMASRRLAVTPAGEMMRAFRAASARDIEIAKWRMNTLDAILNARSGQTQKAIDTLEIALKAQAKIDVAERVEVARQLASLHQQNGAWDSAALALERALALDPGDTMIRVQLADAWDRAGNRLRALEQLKILGHSDSVYLKVASLEAIFNRQLKLPLAEQNLSGVRTSINSLRNKIEQTSLIELSENERVGLQQAVFRLDRLEIFLPPPGVPVEQHLNSPEMAQSVATWAEKHIEDAQIQEFAAGRLAVAGDIVNSDQALARLEKLLGESSSRVVTTRANINAAQGKFREACQILLEQAGKGSSESDRLLQLAASYAARAKDMDLAYQALLSIPESNRSTATLFKLARIARQFPTDSKIVLDQKLSPTELSDQWKTELQQREGDKGTYWRFLEADHLIRQLPTDPRDDDPRLTEAHRLVRELLSIRPRWGEAITLEGRLLAKEGKHDQAIEQLRQGIAAGDRRLATQHLLWGQLIAAGRDAEAEEAIRFAEFSSLQQVDKNSAMQITLALREGDFARSLDMARDVVKEQPNDLIARIILARTAIVASQVAATTAEDRLERFEEAQNAISKAESLAGSDRIAILATSLSLALAKDDPVAVRQQIERIKASKLDEFDRLNLASRGLFAIKDYEAALPLLVRADVLRHSSQSQLNLARVYRQLNQPNLEIDALRKARKLDFKNVALRNQLARALATRDGKNINWKELEGLLQGTRDAKETNRFLYAILLATYGDDNQSIQAASILREIIEEQNSSSNDAARILAVLLRRRIPQVEENAPAPSQDAKRVEQAISEIRSLYDSLTRLSPPASVDLFRYADFLLIHGQPDDLVRVEKLQEILHSTKDGTLAALEIGVRLAEKDGRREESPAIVSQWAEGEIENGLLKEADVSAIAGNSLVKLGFVDEGLQWMERAYRADSKMLSRYVVILNQVDRPQRALALCTQHHQKHADVRSAILLSETILNSPPELITKEHREILDVAILEKRKNPQPEDAMLLESVATWRMQEQDYKGAVELYDTIDQIARDQNPGGTTRIRTLNNLAMAYSELPGFESGGIEPIKRAIKLAGNNPALLSELLDTYGVVLLRSGSLVEAEKVFRSAILKNPKEPRFKFHLILTLEKQNKDSEAKALWRTLDVKKLDPKGLTDSDSKEFEKMKSENLIHQSGNEGQITQ